MTMTPRVVSNLVATRTQAVERTLTGLKLLPSNAAVAMKVLELKRRANAGAAEFAKVIAADPALSAKVLAMANSAAFSPASPVTRVSSAVAMIGLSNLLPLVFGVSLAGIFNKLSLSASDQTMLWRASLLKAVTAREHVRRIGGTFASPDQREAAAEEAFLVGLLQDVALPVFYAADPSSWPEFLAGLDGPEADRLIREQKIFGTDHATIASRCLRMLQLPELFAKVIERHHQGMPAISAANGAHLAGAIDAAAALPHRLPSFSAKMLQTLVIRVRTASGASIPEITELTRGVAEEFARVTALFAEPEEASASFKQFMQNLGAEVADCLQSSIASSITEINGLKDRERRLHEAVVSLEDQAQRAEFDTLTKVLSRAAFLSRLTKLLALARQHAAACAVGFLDLDNFKRVNDTYGHSAGDAALVETSSMLSAAVRDIGIVGRIGGDEFVFAFVSRPPMLAQIIEGFTSRTTHVAVPVGDQRLQLTTSIGIVPLGIPEPDATADSVLATADQLMYQAKRGGKGRATVGTPASLNAATPSAA